MKELERGQLREEFDFDSCNEILRNLRKMKEPTKKMVTYFLEKLKETCKEKYECICTKI